MRLPSPIAATRFGRVRSVVTHSPRMFFGLITGRGSACYDHGMDRLVELLGEVKKLAQEYCRLTGKPLGVTGEIAEFEAARLLGIQLCRARQAGYDAIRVGPDGD